MRRRSVSLVLHGLRALSAAVALLALLTAAAYAWRTDWIYAVDHQVESWFLDGPYQRLRDGEALLQTDRRRGLEILAELAGALDDYLPGDRQIKICTRAYQLLAKAHAADGDWQAAAAAADAWLARDQRNVGAWLRWAAILTELPARRNEAVAGLAQLQHQLPDEAELTRTLVGLLGAEQRWAEAGAALAAHLAMPRPGDWETFNKVRDARFVAHDFLTPHIAEDGRLFLTFDVPVDTEEVGLYLPRAREIELHEPVLLLRRGGEVIRVAFDGPGVKLDQIEWRDGVLHTGSRKRPRILLTPPEPLAAGASLSLTAEVRQGVAAKTATLLLTDGQRMVDALSATEQGQARGLLRVHRALAAVGRELMVFWRDEEAGFAGTRRTAARPRSPGRQGDAVPFVVELPVGAAATELRIDFPEGLGCRWALDGIEVLSTEGTFAPALDEIEVRGRHALSGELDALEVVDKDPYFSFLLDRRRIVESVRLRGKCR